MASTLNTLTDIFRHRKTTAIRDGKIDINRVRGEIASGGYVDRDFIQICAAIEKTGDAMVDDWLIACGEATDQKFSKLNLRKSAHDLIEGFIVDAKTWRRIPPAFHGHRTTNRYMDEELDKVRERLEARFDDGQNRLALKPQKKWHELNPMTWVILSGAILALIVAVHTANELDSCGQNEWAPRATLGMFLAVVNGRQSYSTKLSRPFAGSNRSQKKSWR